jgi:hypothetical protein
VGNGTDFVATVSTGSISAAIGSFDNATDVTSENDSQFGQNAWSLQLNTNGFSTPACKGAQPPPLTSCQGWQQFVYEQGGGIYIEYWLLNYGPNCPGGAWQSFNGVHCWGNSNMTQVPFQPLAALTQLRLTAQVTAGTDAVLMSTGNQYFATNADSINLRGNWQSAEFNIFGAANSSQANFNVGATITVRTFVNSGVAGAVNPVSCASTGFTGETTNLFLVTPCPSVAVGSNAIVFTERLLGPPPAGSPFVGSPTAFDVVSSVYNNQQHFMYRDATSNI